VIVKVIEVFPFLYLLYERSIGKYHARENMAIIRPEEGFI
jgi:hypothetical protein